MTTETNNNPVENGNVSEVFDESHPLRENVQTQEEVKKKRSFKETCSFVLKNVTVEPTMFLFILAMLTTVITGQNLNLEKACRINLNFTSEICDSLKSQTLGEQNIYERDVQQLVAKAMTWRTYITASLPCMLALFVGSWSDKTGYRKIFLIIPLAGQMLSCLNGIINTYFFNQLRLEVFVFTDAVIDGLSGSWCVCLLTMFAYISAITTNENRTFRMGIINFSLTVGFPIGMGLSGVLLKKIGYYGCYGISGSLHLLNILYNVFILKDPPRSPEQKLVSKFLLLLLNYSNIFLCNIFSHTYFVTFFQHDKKGKYHLARLFFNLTNVKDTIQVVFKNGPNNRRLRICIMLLVVSILFGPMHGEMPF